MSTITKEQLRERAREKVKSLEFAVTQTAFADSRTELEEELELARIALASLEAEAVAFRSKLKPSSAIGSEHWDYTEHRQPDAFELESCVIERLYTAPPAPVSVPTFDEWLEIRGNKPLGWVKDAMRESYDACRAAMLQGAAGNSPAIPDGWVLVPVEPTAEMISSGIAAHYERSQIQIHDRPAPGPMECAYVAMLAAAPQQEVK
ncbi:hypothetical protein [Enterobacter kobei]|uniref:hypothetical protein n=1 Tax=Enterobacter kobei TaxID=208224 RepID=UPI001C8B9E1E|nr:hypothetical protein [Enterobacter kobei]